MYEWNTLKKKTAQKISRIGVEFRFFFQLFFTNESIKSLSETALFNVSNRPVLKKKRSKYVNYNKKEIILNISLRLFEHVTWDPMKTIGQFATSICAWKTPATVQVAAVDDIFIHRLQFFRPFNGWFELDFVIVWAIRKQLNLWWTIMQKRIRLYVALLLNI